MKNATIEAIAMYKVINRQDRKQITLAGCLCGRKKVLKRYLAKPKNFHFNLPDRIYCVDLKEEREKSIKFLLHATET